MKREVLSGTHDWVFDRRALARQEQRARKYASRWLCLSTLVAACIIAESTLDAGLVFLFGAIIGFIVYRRRAPW